MLRSCLLQRLSIGTIGLRALQQLPVGNGQRRVGGENEIKRYAWFWTDIGSGVINRNEDHRYRQANPKDAPGHSIAFHGSFSFLRCLVNFPGEKRWMRIFLDFLWHDHYNKGDVKTEV